MLLNRLSTLALPLFAGAALGAPATAQCADQFQLDGAGQEQVAHSTRTIGQTFRVSQNGPFDGVELSILEMGIGAPNDLTLEVLDMSGGDMALAPVLGSLSFSETDLGLAPLLLQEHLSVGTYFDLSALGIFVLAGDELALRISSTRVLPERYNVRIALADAYGPGAFHVDDVAVEGADAAFKAFVGTAAFAAPVFGSGVNPVVLQPGPVAPVLGSTWMPLVTGPLSPSDIGTFLLFGEATPLAAVPPYEFLIQPYSPAVMIPVNSSLTQVPVPFSCKFAGHMVGVQAFSIAPGEPNGYALSNALYLTIGTF